MTHGLTRPLLALLVLVACGPGGGSEATDTAASTSIPGTTSTSEATTAPTTGDPPGTTTGTTGDPSTTDVSTTGGVVECGDVLPPEGSACAPDGAICAPDADDCSPYTEADCIGGTWMYVDIGPGDPEQCTEDCEPFPQDGEPCMTDGTFCSSGCEDQCSFCNSIQCMGGTWMQVEVFPAPCIECEEICPLTVDAMCPKGPPDEATCVAGCMDAMNGRCNIAFSNLRACVGLMDAPVFMCDAMDRPFAVDCELQFDAYYDCAGL
jgi:hypothetical protein